MPSCNICDEAFHNDNPLHTVNLSVDGTTIAELKACISCYQGNITEIMTELEDALRSL